jgi:HAD superfamily hydrolase (TIGR01450 family)
MAWVLDLDGVIWRGERPIEGSARAVARLREANETIVFVTNNSFAPASEVAAKLERAGIDARDDVVTSAMAAALLVEPGDTVLLCGGPGAREELEERGATVVDDFTSEVPDAVVVGFHRDFTYERMAIATRAVRGGARLIATNDDATFPTADGIVPGGGAILASIVTASGQAAVVAGKPYPPIVDYVRSRVGSWGIAVGDRPDTDGRFAHALGFRFGLVLTGVTRPSDFPVEPPPDLLANDLESLVIDVLDGAGGSFT